MSYLNDEPLSALPQVVNCTGAWGPYISEMAGVDCPLVPFRHAYVVTENIPGTVIN